MSVSVTDLGRPHQPKRRAQGTRRARPDRQAGAHRAGRPLELRDLRSRLLAARRHAARAIASI